MPGYRKISLYGATATDGKKSAIEIIPNCYRYSKSDGQRIFVIPIPPYHPDMQSRDDSRTDIENVMY